MSDYRVVTIESLKKIINNNSYSNIVINNDLKLLDNSLQNVYRKSVMGVIENLYFLDYVINKFSSTRAKKLQTEISVTLRLAIYQIFFLDNSKEFVIVNESVEYIKKKLNIKASKFVNAILRNIIRNKESILNDITKLDRLQYLSVKYSYPEWLINRFIKLFGKENIEDVLIKNNQEAKLNIRVNTNKVTKDELKARLEAKGIVCRECSIADKGLIVDNVVGLERLEEFREGLFSVQSESSMLVGQALNPKPESLIVDMCAAPGGKTMDAAERMNNTGKVISRDLYEQKIQLIKNDVKRLGLNNVNAQMYDASKPDKDLLNSADYCIVDVPCSGLGIIRRKPEIKYNRQEPDSDNLFDIQYTILKNASDYLRVGGELIYSTCTTDKKENINVIKRFLDNHDNFEPVDIEDETKGIFNTAKDGYIEVYPHIHDMDGFFIAKLRKSML